MDGFLNLYKPSGWTSHDCVAKLRRILGQKKVGHGGTLDPMATGVLPIALGRATRLIQYLPGDKAYTATLRFGLTTTTDDIEGETIATHPADGLTRDRVIAAIPAFLGTIEQIPPKYSAIQVGGKRLYDLARAGKDVDVPVRTVVVSAIEPGAWRGGNQPELDVTIACGTGTYIRAIARDLGHAVGTGATLSKLERIASSGFTLAASLTLEALAAQVDAGTFAPMSPLAGVSQLPIVAIAGEMAQRWRLGQTIEVDPVVTDAIVTVDQNAEAPQIHEMAVCICDTRGEFLGIGRLRLPEGRLRPKLVYVPA